MEKSLNKQTRVRFSTADDLNLLRNVAGLNPFDNKDMWEQILANLIKASGKKFTLQLLKDHLDHLLKLFIKDDKVNIKKSGTEEEYEEKERLLEEIRQLKEEFKETNLQQKKNNGRKKGIEERDTASSSVPLDIYNYDEAGVFTEAFQDEAEEHREEITVEYEHEENAATNVILENINLIESPQLSTRKVETRQSQHNIQDSSRNRKRRGARDEAINYLTEKQANENSFRKHELQLTERKLELEERRMHLEEQKFELEREERLKRLDVEILERENRIKMEMNAKDTGVAISNQLQDVVNYFINNTNN